MSAFKDAEGRQWEVRIDVAQIKRVRSLLDFDMRPMFVGDGAAAVTAVLNDVVQFVDILYVLCKDQADMLGLDDTGFARIIFGASLEEAVAAFVDAVLFFSPNQRASGMRRKAIAKTKALMDREVAKAEEKIDALTDEAILRILTDSSGASPAPSASTPAPSPSAN